jgi:hypothetical protein
MAATYNTVAGDPRGAAVEGLSFDFSGLTITFEEGLIDGRAVASATAVPTAATTTFRGFLVSEDGDSTYTVTQTADDSHASAALAAAAALLLKVPAGGVGVITGAVNNATTLSLLSMEVRGKLPAVTNDQ